MKNKIPDHALSLLIGTGFLSSPVNGERIPFQELAEDRAFRCKDSATMKREMGIS